MGEIVKFQIPNSELRIPRLLQIGRNRLYRTGGNALLADDTPRSTEVEVEGFGIESEGLGGTNAGTQTTVYTTSIVD